MATHDRTKSTYRRTFAATALACGWIFVAAWAQDTPAPAAIGHAQGEMAGEVTQTSVILQSRLTVPNPVYGEDVAGAPGTARFEISLTSDFAEAVRTPWLPARPINDCIVKAVIRDLKPGTLYHYRLVFGATDRQVTTGETRMFKTLALSDSTEPVRFVVVTGMNYAKFHTGPNAYTGPDKPEGYPALESIRKLKPDFFVGTGDNIYYDYPKEGAADTIEAMRRKWHEQFVQPRYVRLFAEVPTYWEKDDHDYRYNDSDRVEGRLPSHETGLRVFREQVPVVAPDRPRDPTYRTHRINGLLQIWLVEGRDYRSPNKSPDGPDKTIWGNEQTAWLKRTLLESDAPVKVLISPTPMVGPDDATKTDNHVNLEGFRHEGDQFFAWLTENGFLEKGFYLVCGDRHWQYHSIHPSGFEEFSTGALVQANSRLGRKPGDPESTDPEAKVKQPFTNDKPTGGFLDVLVSPTEGGARAEFAFRNEQGDVLYSATKTVSARKQGLSPFSPPSPSER